MTLDDAASRPLLPREGEQLVPVGEMQILDPKRRTLDPFVIGFYEIGGRMLPSPRLQLLVARLHDGGHHAHPRVAGHLIEAFLGDDAQQVSMLGREHPEMRSESITPSRQQKHVRVGGRDQHRAFAEALAEFEQPVHQLVVGEAAAGQIHVVAGTGKSNRLPGFEGDRARPPPRPKDRARSPTR